jgi:hypothetical protein
MSLTSQTIVRRPDRQASWRRSLRVATFSTSTHGPAPARRARGFSLERRVFRPGGLLRRPDPALARSAGPAVPLDAPLRRVAKQALRRSTHAATSLALCRTLVRRLVSGGGVPLRRPRTHRRRRPHRLRACFGTSLSRGSEVAPIGMAAPPTVCDWTFVVPFIWPRPFFSKRRAILVGAPGLLVGAPGLQTRRPGGGDQSRRSRGRRGRPFRSTLPLRRVAKQALRRSTHAATSLALSRTLVRRLVSGGGVPLRCPRTHRRRRPHRLRACFGTSLSRGSEVAPIGMAAPADGVRLDGCGPFHLPDRVFFSWSAGYLSFGAPGLQTRRARMRRSDPAWADSESTSAVGV